jgi:hypothetical protein
MPRYLPLLILALIQILIIITKSVPLAANKALDSARMAGLGIE